VLAEPLRVAVRALHLMPYNKWVQAGQINLGCPRYSRGTGPAPLATSARIGIITNLMHSDTKIFPIPLIFATPLCILVARTNHGGSKCPRIPKN
jgi:hypothetical protein